MGFNAAYNVSKDIGNNIAKGFRESQDSNAIESILSSAMQSGKQEDLNSAIGKILSQVSPERQADAVKILQNSYENVSKKNQTQRQNTALKNEGIDPNLPSNIQLQKYKDKSPVKKTQASQPIDAEQLKLIQSVRNTVEYEQADPLQKYQMLTDAQVSKENAQAEADIAAKKTDISQKNERENKEYNLRLHNLSEKYATNLQERGEAARKTKNAIVEARQALKNKPTGALTSQNIFKKTFKGTPFENLGLSPEGAVLEATIPTFLEGQKEIFGVRLSDADLAIVAGKTIDLGKSVEANNAILDWAEKSADYSHKKAELAKKIEKENGYLRPLGFQNLVDEEFDKKYGDQIDRDFEKTFGERGTVRVIGPGETKPVSIPRDQVEAALKSGGRLA